VYYTEIFQALQLLERLEVNARMKDNNFIRRQDLQEVILYDLIGCHPARSEEKLHRLAIT
jgi:hypothetical protein